MLVSSKKRWLKGLAWAIGIVLVLHFSRYYLWVGYILATGPLGGSEVIYTDTTCGDGEYRIVVHQYQSGDGYLELTNKAGKVFDSAKYTRGVDYAPFRWQKGCKKVLVGSNDGLVFLEAK